MLKVFVHKINPRRLRCLITGAAVAIPGIDHNLTICTISRNLFNIIGH